MSIEQEIKDNLRKIIGTPQFPRFVYWVLTDPLYGLCNLYACQEQRKLLCVVVNLYRDWIDTGIFPNQLEWSGIVYDGNIIGGDMGYAVSNAAYANIHQTDIVESILAVTNPINRMLSNDPKSAQLEKLKELTNQSENLFFEEDYDYDYDKS